MTAPMHISRVRISNILGIEELAFEPGRFVALTGANGSGKTSVLKAIKAALRGGHDATILRNGAERGEIVLELEDGTEITKRVTAAGSETKVRQDGKLVSRPGERIAQLADLLSVNPVEFLTAAKKDRAQILLETMPIRIDAGRVQQIAGISVDDRLAAAGLPAIDAVRKQVFDERTGTNRAAKEKAATIAQLRAATPDAPGGVDGDEDGLRGQVAQHQQAANAELQRIETKLAGLRQASGERIAALRADAQAKIDAIKAQLDADVEAERAALAGTEAKAGQQRQLTVERQQAACQPIEAAIAAIVSNRDAAAKRKVALETVAQLEGDHQALEEESAAQTRALEALDAYKLELLASLPIAGIEIRDGEILRAGVPFDHLNTAQQVEIAVEVAKLRAGPLGVICVDGLELLDAQHFEAFRQAAVDSGLQMFVTRVGDGAFSITSAQEGA